MREGDHDELGVRDDGRPLLLPHGLQKQGRTLVTGALHLGSASARKRPAPFGPPEARGRGYTESTGDRSQTGPRAWRRLFVSSFQGRVSPVSWTH